MLLLNSTINQSYFLTSTRNSFKLQKTFVIWLVKSRSNTFKVIEIIPLIVYWLQKVFFFWEMNPCHGSPHYQILKYHPKHKKLTLNFHFLFLFTHKEVDRLTNVTLKCIGNSSNKYSYEITQSFLPKISQPNLT